MARKPDISTFKHYLRCSILLHFIRSSGSVQEYVWGDVVFGCLRNHNDAIVTAYSIDACLQHCVDETAFECLSINFDGVDCQLSRANSFNVQPYTDYSQPCYTRPSNWQHWERWEKEYTWSDVVFGCLRGNNDKSVFSNNTEDCRLQCMKEPRFQCLSINYHIELGTCQLSRANSYTVDPPNDYMAPCYTEPSIWQHWERRGKEYIWTDVVFACIRGHNDERIDVSTIEECKQRCVNERNFVCLSIEYDGVTCYLSSVNSFNLDPATDLTTPCHTVPDIMLYSELREQDSPCPVSVSKVSPYGSSCTSVCWSDQGDPGMRNDVERRSHQSSSPFDVGTTEVTYTYNATSRNTSECRFRVSVTEACLSGAFDAVTLTSGQDAYIFVGDKVMKLSQDGTKIAEGYPRPICAEFPGLPSDLDAAVNWPNGETYFFKGAHYWTSNGTTLGPLGPRFIANDFRGVPSNVDAALVWGRRKLRGYFFKGATYYRYDIQRGIVDVKIEVITEGWPGIGTHVDAAFTWTSGVTYFFSGENYWRYNTAEDRAESGYPRSTSKRWLGCRASQDDPPIISASEVCARNICSKDTVPTCLGGDLDAITCVNTGGSMGHIFAFRGMMVAKLTEAAGDVEHGFPKPICEVFPGSPSNLDAAMTTKQTGKTYFFKDNLCYRFSGFQIDHGYPRLINDEFPGIPSNIDAALSMDKQGDGYPMFFFKGYMVYKFDSSIGTVATDYSGEIQSHWNGVPSTIDAAFQWINTWTYFFEGDEFVRWDHVQQRVADGYPRAVSSTWFGCQPTSEEDTCWVRQCP